jgi:AcrR family transcriptional regulator
MRRTKNEAEESKKKIINAAYKVFLRKGFAATNLSDIANEIKMTRGVIYWHFKNKTDLFVCLLIEFLDQAIAYSLEVFKSDETLPNKMKKLLMKDGTSSQVLELLKMFQPETIHRDSKLRQETKKAVAQKIQSMFNSFVAFLSDEQKAGHIRKDVDIQAFASTYMMISSVLNVSDFQRSRASILSVPENKRDSIVDFFWNGLNSAFL